jgi:hypothetical protein
MQCTAPSPLENFLPIPTCRVGWFSHPYLVEQEMDKTWGDELAIVKAQLAVQHMALRALAHSHPQPTALLEEWRKLRADSVAAAYSLPGDVRNSEWLNTQVQAFAEDWTAELVDAVTRRPDRQASASDPDPVSA